MILCVDLDDQVLSVCKFMLEMRGYAVKTAKTDEQAIDVLKRGDFDLILSRLPGVIGEVKAMGLVVPTVFLAGYAELGKAEADAVLVQGTQSPVRSLPRSKRSSTSSSSIGSNTTKNRECRKRCSEH